MMSKRYICHFCGFDCKDRPGVLKHDRECLTRRSWEDMESADKHRVKMKDYRDREVYNLHV